MEVFIFLNFHPPRNDLVFWARLSATKSFAQKNSHVPTKFEKWPCSRKIWEATMLQKIWEATMLQTMWEATMLHQKINMTVSLQWMEVFIFLNFHPPGYDLIFGPDCPLPRTLIKKYPCSNKIWKLTMLQKNLRSDHAPNNVRSDHAPSKNKYDRFPPKCDKWNMVIFQIMVETFS